MFEHVPTLLQIAHNIKLKYISKLSQKYTTYTIGIILVKEWKGRIIIRID